MRTRFNLMIVVAIAAGIFVLAPLTSRFGFQGAQRGAAKKVDMSAPAPRLPNGKPSMSGVWGQVRRADVTDAKIPGFVKELPYTEWGKKQWDLYDAAKGDYTGTCLPFGLSRTIYGPHPIQVIQDNDNFVFLA